MMIYSKIKQYYHYHRIWRKLQARINKDQHLSEPLDFYSQFIEKGSLCFDIGANIGDKTELFVRLGAKVVAVEPQQSCRRVLKRRFKDDDVTIESVALAEKNGSRQMYVDRSHTLATISEDWISTVKKSGRFSGHKWPDKLTVQTTTLDELIEKHGSPAYCKIDVEGSEFDVLQGLSQPIKTISLEFVPESVKASLKCINYLDKLGKAEFNYCLNDSNSFALTNWVDSDRMKAILKEMNKDIENYGDFYVRFAV